MTIQDLTQEYNRLDLRLKKVKSVSQKNHYLKLQLQVTNEIREILNAK